MSNPATRTFLLIAAALVGLTGAVQAVLGGMAAFGNYSIEPVHGIVGMATCVIAIIGAVAAFLSGRQTGNKGLFMHAAGVAVIAVAQVALGELRLTALHITLGSAYAIAAIALATLAFRKQSAA